MSSGFLEGAHTVESRSIAHLIRFFAHLVLFLRQLGIPVTQESGDKILDAYVNVLKDNDKGELVALYASNLDEENEVESYAQYLAGKSFYLAS